MSDPYDNSDDLVRRLQQVRSRLSDNVTATRQTVHDWTDWRSYVKAGPLVSFALAAGLGYLVVPKQAHKPETTSNRASSTRRRMVLSSGEHKMKPDATTGSSTTTAAVLSGALSVAMAGVIRAAATRLTGYVVDSLSAPRDQKQRHVSRIRPSAVRPR